VVVEWAARNRIAFDHGKTEAALFRKKKRTPTATVTVGDRMVPFSKEATRWLGIWLDPKLTLKDHRATCWRTARWQWQVSAGSQHR